MDRAQRLASRNQAIADRQAQRTMAPMLYSNAQQQVAALKQSMLTTKDAQGRTVDPAALETLLSVMPPELAAKPEVARFIYYAAKGMTEHNGKAPTVAPSPVVMTESVGSGGRGPAGPSQIEQNFAKATGVKAADFANTAAQYKPGHVNSLE